MDNINGTDAISAYPNGTIIADRFEIESFLAAGGMAQVYVARQINIDRRVAMKVLSPMFSMNPSVVMRFFREARVIAQLSHPNTVRLFDMGETPDKRLYMAMELLEGAELSERIRQGRMNAAEALPIVRQVAGSLSEAHAKGIIHRDLKPDNIFLTKLNFVKVLDFGIAKLKQGDEDDERRLTKVGTAPGTPEYMSPEQARGKELDARSDLYSLGVVLYEMLAGRPPFEEETFLATILMHVQSPPPPLPDDIPADLRNYVINRLLAKDPNCRPDNADAFIREIDELAQKITPSKEQALIDELRSQLAATKLELLRSCEHSVIEEADADRLYSERMQAEQLRNETNRSPAVNPNMPMPGAMNLGAQRRPMPQMPVARLNSAQSPQMPAAQPYSAQSPQMNRLGGAPMSGVSGAVNPNMPMPGAQRPSMHQMPAAQPMSGVSGIVNPNMPMPGAMNAGAQRPSMHQMPAAQPYSAQSHQMPAAQPYSAQSPQMPAAQPYSAQSQQMPAAQPYSAQSQQMNRPGGPNFGAQPMHRSPVPHTVQAPTSNCGAPVGQCRPDAVYFAPDADNPDDIVVPAPRRSAAPMVPGSPKPAARAYSAAESDAMSRPRSALTGKPIVAQQSMSKPPLVIFLEFAQPLLKSQKKDIEASLTMAQFIWNAAVRGGQNITDVLNEVRDRPKLTDLVQHMLSRKEKYFPDEFWTIENLKVEVFDGGKFKCEFDAIGE